MVAELGDKKLTGNEFELRKCYIIYL